MLFKKIDGWREIEHFKPLPEYISKNLNPAFELRDYQKKAFENFITYFEKNPPHPTQVLFHMATGSGKTLIMAGLMLYLYKKGYRNFLFFVNLTNILEKTKDNFLNPVSSKYLFADEIIIDGDKVRINPVDNFQYSDEGAINICFATTQKLHTDMFFAKENGMCFDDFNELKTVLISDESHHLNVDTKKANKKNKEESENHQSWEETVKKLFERNSGNVLLEFTATCNIENAEIKKAYEDKIIFNYPLQSFYDDKYSKDILTLRSDLPVIDKALQAVILSQYRLKVFQDNRLSIKPVVLFKALSIAESKKFMAEFIDEIKKLTGERLKKISETCGNEIIDRAFKYFSAGGISLDTLAAELRDDFSEQNCISANDEKEAEKKQLILNSLEDSDNPYRAIFEVRKLDEGWDVLNLFDIVRLYETRQSGGKKISSTTIAEAQLIGRGARYCPFKLNDEQPKFQRKYDNDVDGNLRICETLYYHCQNDSRYITELKNALRETGLDTEKIIRREYVLKEKFKSDDLYKTGVIFLNRRIVRAGKNIDRLPDSVSQNIYSFRAGNGISESDKIMTDNSDTVTVKTESHTARMTIKEIAAKNYSIVNKALMKYPVYKFNNLKSLFPNLKSCRQFIIDKNYLGDVRIDITGPEKKFSPKILYDAVFDVLGKIAETISKVETAYEGTREFNAKRINEIFGAKKTVNYSDVKDGSTGISQKDPSTENELRIDLSAEDWFAHTDNFGTSEEKAFVAYFRDRVEELKKIYDKIYLVRNEREFHIYSFDDGERFEPDFVLFLRKNKNENFEQIQIFIEPKGTHLLKNDEWKEKFLLRLKDEAITVKNFTDDDEYKIWGLKFFNKDTGLKSFDESFKVLVKDSSARKKSPSQ